MALSDQNNMVMPVAPFGGNMGGGFGGFGGDGWTVASVYILGLTTARTSTADSVIR